MFCFYRYKFSTWQVHPHQVTLKLWIIRDHHHHSASPLWTSNQTWSSPQDLFLHLNMSDLSKYKFTSMCSFVWPPWVMEKFHSLKQQKIMLFTHIHVFLVWFPIIFIKTNTYTFVCIKLIWLSKSKSDTHLCVRKIM